MEQPKVSVIIPLYNAEKTLSRCMNSVLKQNYSNLEIILIDDGSTDNTYEICKQYQQNHSNLIVSRQSNRGPAVARNHGIKCSTGKYLAFVDADDYISYCMIDTLVEKAEIEQSELVICAYWNVSKKGIKEQYYNFDEGVYEGKQAKELLYSMIQRDSMEDIPPFSCMRLVLRDIIIRHELWFCKELIRSEDFHFWCRVHQYVNRVFLLSKTPLYYYVNNTESITHRYIPRYWDGVKLIYEDLMKLADYDNTYICKLNKMIIMRSKVALTNSFRCTVVKNALCEIFQIIFDPCLYKSANDLPSSEITVRKKYIFLIRHHCRFLLYLGYVYYYLMKVKRD